MSDLRVDELDGSGDVAQLWSQVSVILPERTKQRLVEAARSDRWTVSRQAWEYIERDLAEAHSSTEARR
jgi:hypothetical protein